MPDKKKKLTDFPQKGDNQAISLSNSKYPQADYAHALMIKEQYPELWRKGGNIYGNTAFEMWTKYRAGERTDGVLAWVKKRQAWFARHYGDKNVPGIIAWLKWGGYGQHGKSGVKKILREEINKINARKKRRKKVASLANTYANYHVTDLTSLNTEAEILYGLYPTEKMRAKIIALKKVYMVFFMNKLGSIDPVQLNVLLHNTLKDIYAYAKPDFSKHRKLVDFAANIFVKISSLGF